MSLETIGAVLLVLVVVFVFSQIWFHFIEGLLGFIKRLFRRKTPPPAWHTLSQEKEKDQ